MYDIQANCIFVVCIVYVVFYLHPERKKFYELLELEHFELTQNPIRPMG